MTAELLAARGDKSAKEAIVRENAGLIWSIVRRFTGRGVDTDDLFQLGCLGLLKAIEGFDPGYGTQFSTYAVPKIAGEIRRHLRDDGSVKVSRTLKEQAVKIRRAREALAQRLGREPLLSEVSEATGLSLEEIAQAETAAMPADSLERPAGEDGHSLSETLAGGEIEEEILESIALKEAMGKLEERQRAVIGMRYYRGMTQDQTARVLGISQVQVSRIEKKALGEMRRLMEG